MLQVEQIKKNYDTFELDCSLEVEKGRVTGLVGLNGAGKSTTFKSILDLVRPDSGNIKIFGVDHCKLSVAQKEDIGVVLPEHGFSGYLSIKTLLPVLASFYHNFKKEEFLKNCENMGLDIKKPIREFSTGMQAKLKLLIAMSHSAKLLILDEPTVGLDVQAREELLNMLREYMEEDEERSILISSHISSDLEGFCDDIYVIHGGKIVLHENTDTITDEYGLLKVSEKEYEKMDKTYILYSKKEFFGYSCLTKEKQFYMDNYPDMVIQKGGIDDVLLMMDKKK